ncbi:MAG: exo-beta-N-acetylmuramidase NamZ domain-containing protein [Bdellovibrionales bacterium]
MFQLGLERLLSDASLRGKLRKRKIAVLGHPASVDRRLLHTLDLLMAEEDLEVSAAFGPQHGMRGEKQDNMIESDDYVDPIHKIPVHSLYGQVRRPTREMMKNWDVLLVDLQDVGCRIYTFLTTLFYMMEAVAETGQEIWVLDRPNPAGRAIEGHILNMDFASFVGAAPVPMRHGLTLGEAALWYKDFMKLKVDLTVVSMMDYQPTESPWPDLAWVNPSPNIPRLSCTKIYPGSVLIEGTLLSEGRGTTIPLEIFGAPKLDIPKVLAEMQEMAPAWLTGCVLRPAFFEPTFHKFKGELVNALQVHVDGPYADQSDFRPYRLVCLFFKACQRVHPDLKIWRPPPYEYETEKMPIDILSGHDSLRKWVADAHPKIQDWESSLAGDELRWSEQREPFLIYK